MGQHSKHDMEIEASCRAWEQNGTRLAGDAKGAVALWFDDDSILASDGVCKAGKVDRLGRPKGKGRGCGVADIAVPVEVVPGSIVEWVPVSVKGCSASGYGNRDLTQHHETVLRHAEAGRACWVMLVTVKGGTLVMRRIDASRVIREAEDCWLVRDDVRKYTKKDGTEVVKVYKRLRLEWARVNKRHPHLFHDADWTEFSATLPDWPY